MSTLKFIFLILIWFSTGLMLSQNYEIHYKKGLIIDIKNNNNLIDKELKVKVNNVKKSIDGLNYILRTADDYYTFYLSENMETDAYTVSKRAVSSGKGKGVYIYYVQKGLNVKNISSVGEKFIVRVEDIEFSLKSATKNILGFNCLKAIGSYEYRSLVSGETKKIFVEAWYASGFPIQYGPIGINNLPGMVLQLDIGKVRYEAIDLKEMKKEKLKVKKINFDQTISEQEYKKILIKAFAKMRDVD